MKTLFTRSSARSAAIIRRGGLVAFPTETVYGLGADAFNAPAIRAIFRAKGRPTDNPLIVHVGDLDQIRLVAARIPPVAHKLISAFFPGPLTLVLPRHPDLPACVAAGLDTIGVRCPDHPIARAFLRACGTPVAAPSANRSGRPSPTTWTAVRDELDGRIHGVLKGGASRVGLESTVLDCTARVPVILREGAITLEDLRRVAPSIRAARVSRGGRRAIVRSPGMKYRHYAPSARVVLVDHLSPVSGKVGGRRAYIGLERPERAIRVDRRLLCHSVSDYARRLFHFFRACERSGIQTIYCQRVAQNGLGRALMDRLEKAAAPG